MLSMMITLSCFTHAGWVCNGNGYSIVVCDDRCICALTILIVMIMIMMMVMYRVILNF